MIARNRHPSATSLYAQLLPTLREVARGHGYALGVHGSLTTDLDLIAVPWSRDAEHADVLIESLRAAVDGTIDQRVFSCTACIEGEAHCPHVGHNPSIRPHGRLAWSIYLNSEPAGPYLDVSVMPRTTP